MHPILRTVLICTLIGLSFGCYFFFTDDHRPLRIFISVLSSVSIGSLMMLVIHFRHYFTRAAGPQPLKVIIMIALLAAAAIAGSELTLLVQSLFSPGKTYQPFAGGSVYMLNILIVMVTGIPIYVSEEWKHMLNSRLLQQQYRVLQLEQQQTVFELELLRAKINPHFLYNVHNTIAGLIATDPGKAEQLVLLLSKFFRSTLTKNSISFHTLTDELDLVTTYLQMQQIRFDDRMTYTIDAEPGILHWPIPSFILQPIIENAVKHGIEPGMEKGSITVGIRREQDKLSIRIADSGAAFPDKPAAGHGLQMVMSKLTLLYENDFTMELINLPQKYVHLLIPGSHQDGIDR